MIIKVKIVKAVITDKNKDGSPCMAAGKPVRRIGIQTEQHSNTWLTCTLWRSGQKEENLKEGQEVEINYTENNGFRNFTIASKTDKLEEEVRDIASRLKRLEDVEALGHVAKPQIATSFTVKKDPRIEPGEPDASEIDF